MPTCDRYGFLHGADGAALGHFAEATHAVVSYRPQALPALDRALTVQPGFGAAHALRGLLHVLPARPELMRNAAAAQAAAHAAGAVTADEVALLRALDLAMAGRQRAAADALDVRLVRSPVNLLLVKLANMLRFLSGDLAGLVGGVARVLPAWNASTPGFGYVLGCQAFALEESGDYTGAEWLGREALDRVTDDAWAVHAVAHAHEMTGRADAGAGWLEAVRPAWTGCAGFGFHVAWHLALFHLECGDHARVLSLYDTEVRPAPTEDVRDVANAVSLLWRLRQEGVAVGRRWDELAAIARRRRNETELLFGTLHNLLALLAVGDLAAARALVDAVADEAAGTRDQSLVARRAGLPLARALLALARRQASPGLDRLARQLQPLGGSHAQRDVWVRTLAGAAAAAGNLEALQGIRGARRALRGQDRFDAMLASGRGLAA
ncbi:MAG TPA: hypothetical protein VGC15_17975 [Acetobacteraceae bacterium]